MLRFILLVMLIGGLCPACTNPKIQIVERQKALADSINKTRFILDSMVKSSFTKAGAIADQEVKIYLFKKEYDSLEFELKKY